MSDVHQILNAHDSDIVFQAILDCTKTDMESLTGDINQAIRANLLPTAIKLQWQMINVMVRTIVHLRKKNAVMENDYKGRNK